MNLNHEVGSGSGPDDGGWGLDMGVGADVAAHLWSVRQAAGERAMYSEGLRAALDSGDTVAAKSLAGRLAALPGIPALEALRAGHQLVDLLRRGQWLEVRMCREEGASWAEVGDALGISASNARAGYQHAVEAHDGDHQDLHDRRRCWAALDDADPNPRPDGQP